MNVLLLGSGGREHALALALSKSPLLSRLFAAPGNPGIARLATLVALNVDDHAAVAAFCKDQSIDLVVDRAGGAACRGPRRFSCRARHQSLWTDGCRCAARRLESLRQRDLRTIFDSDRRLRALQRCAIRQSLSARERRADRRQGRWAGCRQGRDRRRDFGRSGSGDRCHVLRPIRRGRQDRAARRKTDRRRSLLLCALRWQACGGARLGAGS